MLLFIILSTIAFIGIIYGIVKKNKTFVMSSVILLIIIALILLIYSYLYAQNPY